MADVTENPSIVDAKRMVKRTAVQAAFKKVFLEDFGVLFYFFAMLASFGWCWYGSGWANGLDKLCAVRDEVSGATSLGAFFFWVACAYSMTWYNCACCASSVQMPHEPQPLQCYGPVQSALPA
eukprot:CAMPEP_0176249940 /NCGR_PEP_ID=MMETSP0121_2-20121125/34229_1 /TAXON_ID=160619 /ORGANISM="Kryptoperidinium foliaceum, Strain CCMP 1326" /LENGTH=122 /DNA_ID=CAMNT_0017589641 /DNA_START=412 /DNA_END=780 /DNA_ORIENTATION=+